MIQIVSARKCVLMGHVWSHAPLKNVYRKSFASKILASGIQTIHWYSVHKIRIVTMGLLALYWVSVWNLTIPSITVAMGCLVVQKQDARMKDVFLCLNLVRLCKMMFVVTITRSYKTSALLTFCKILYPIFYKRSMA